MGLTAGALGPGLLRLYWWRTNAWGMSAGLFTGGLAAVLQRGFNPHMSEWLQFTLMTGLSLGATVLVSLATQPVPAAIVKHFYRTTRPFGWWGAFKAELPASDRRAWSIEHRYDILSAISALVWQVCLFLLPMEILTRNFSAALTTLPLFLTGCAGLYFFWWRHLPPKDEVVADFVHVRPDKQAKAAAGEVALH